MENETYLGDGLYASFDGWMITLRAPRENGDHWVALEPDVMLAMLKFAERVGMITKRAPRSAPSSSKPPPW